MRRRQNVSPDPRRRLAHAAAPGLLPRWIASAARLLKPQGVLTLIWRADALAEVLSALTAEFGGIAVLPVLPRADAPAIRVLVRAVKSGRGAPLSYPALILNDAARPPDRGRGGRAAWRRNAEYYGDVNARRLCLGFAPPRHEFAPAPGDELAPHAVQILVVEMRKPNNAADQQEQDGELGIHRSASFK